MKRIAYLIQTKLPNYKEYAFYAYNMPYNHQWWEEKYIRWDKLLAQTPFTSLRNQCGSVPLTRQMIIDMFRQKKYYDGFLCAMVWGNIGTNLGGQKCFTSVFDINNKQKIDADIHNVISLLQQGYIQQAYQSLQSSGANKIGRIGEAFFTKLLYFSGAAINNPILYPSPIIFDRIMHDVYDTIVHIIGYQSPHGATARYMDYCSKMEELRNLLILPTSGHVEALLFCPGIRNYIFH